jgi:ADP-heptose:LPS heptosyltransferase
MSERARMRRERIDSVQNILVMRAGALGDCLLMLPALNALRAHFAQAHIDVMGYPERWAWVLGRGLVDAVHCIERPGMHLLFCPGGQIPESLRSFFSAYDIILSYRPDPDGAFAQNLRALGIRLVLSQPPLPPPPPPKIHVADFALQLLTSLGVPPPPLRPQLCLTDDEVALTQPFFNTQHVDPAMHSIVVVHPGSGSEAKRWPVENFAALIEALGTLPRVRTVVVAGYAEQNVVARLLRLIHKAKPLIAENWPLLPTMALIGQATVFVGHDSGLTHLAAVLGRPTVAIFGPTDPEIWGPRGERVTVVQMVSEDAVGDGRDRGCKAFQLARRDVRGVLEAVHCWLAMETPRRSPGDQSV